MFVDSATLRKESLESFRGKFCGEKVGEVRRFIKHEREVIDTFLGGTFEKRQSVDVGKSLRLRLFFSLAEKSYSLRDSFQKKNKKISLQIFRNQVNKIEPVNFVSFDVKKASFAVRV